MLPLWLQLDPEPRSTIAPPQQSWGYLTITLAPGKTASTHRLRNYLSIVTLAATILWLR